MWRKVSRETDLIQIADKLCDQQWNVFHLFCRFEQLNRSYTAERGHKRLCRSARPASRFANRTASQLGGKHRGGYGGDCRCKHQPARLLPPLPQVPRRLGLHLIWHSCNAHASCLGCAHCLAVLSSHPSFTSGNHLKWLCRACSHPPPELHCAPNSTTATAPGNSYRYLQSLTVLRLLLRSQSATGVGSQQGLCLPCPPENLSEGEDESSHTGAFTTPASGIGPPQVFLPFPHA